MMRQNYPGYHFSCSTVLLKGIIVDSYQLEVCERTAGSRRNRYRTRRISPTLPSTKFGPCFDTDNFVWMKTCNSTKTDLAQGNLRSSGTMSDPSELGINTGSSTTLLRAPGVRAHNQ
eukprot:3549859-Rhodomonas_salina.2